MIEAEERTSWPGHVSPYPPMERVTRQSRRVRYRQVKNRVWCFGMALMGLFSLGSLYFALQGASFEVLERDLAPYAWWAGFVVCGVLAIKHSLQRGELIADEDSITVLGGYQMLLPREWRYEVAEYRELVLRTFAVFDAEGMAPKTAYVPTLVDADGSAVELVPFLDRKLARQLLTDLSNKTGLPAR